MRRNKSPSHAGSGHTDAATINARRPMTARMRALLESVRDGGADCRRLAHMSRAERNVARALVNRGYAEYFTSPGAISCVHITPTGREALKQ